MNQDPAKSLGNIKSRNTYRRMLGSSIASLAVFLFAFTLIPTLISEASADSEDVSAGVRWGAVSLALDPDVAATASGDSSVGDEGHGDIDFGELVPSSKTSTNFGTFKVLKKTIGITSTGSYYSVYLSTNGTTNSLNYSSSETSANIPAIASDGTNDGSFDAPAQMLGNGWGFAAPGTPVETSDSDPASPTFPSFGLTKTQFSSQDITDILNTQIIKEAGNTAAETLLYDSSRWAAVPVKSSPQLIWKAESNSPNGFGTYTNGNGIPVTGDTDNDKFDIYYGLMVNTNTLAGTYSNQIVYTALASATAIDKVSNNIVISTNIGGQGEPETVSFELADSATSITEDDITIALVPHKELVTANYMELNDQEFTLDKLGHDIDYYATTYGTCAITPGSLNISNGSDGAISSLECTMPNANRTSPYPEDASTYIPGRGSFDLWMQIGKYNYDYLTKIEYEANTYIPAFVYAGLQSKWSGATVGVDTNDDGEEDATVKIDPRHQTESGTSTDRYELNKIVKTMQQITPHICSLTRKWNNQAGSDARILEFSGEATTDSTDVDYNAEIGRGTFDLIDERDQKTYLVRRLADGNCWMVQELALDLSSFANTTGLTSENTDLNTKGTWNAIDGVDEDSTPAYTYSSENNAGTYNFYAASAGSIAKSEYDTNMSDSICPKNWKVPEPHTQWRNLASKYVHVGSDSYVASDDVSKMYEIPLSFTANRGYMTDKSYGESSLESAFWVRNNDRIRVSDAGYKNQLRYIRCVAR